MLVPADTPVTTPELFTVATPGVAEAHGVVPSGEADPVNVVVNPTQTLNVPVIVGNALTVIVAVCVQPILFVKVITLVPAEIPVTKPVLSTIAIPGVFDTHGEAAAGVSIEFNGVVELTHTFKFPVIADALQSVRANEFLAPKDVIPVKLALLSVEVDESIFHEAPLYKPTR